MSMTDCPRGDIRDLLPDLLHDRLDDATRAEVTAHVDGCAECAAELRLLHTASAALRPQVQLDTERIARAVLRVPVAARRRELPAWLLPVAAALMLLLTGALALALLSGPEVGPDSVAQRSGEPGQVTGPFVAEGPDARVDTGAPRLSGGGEIVLTASAGLFVGGLSDLDDDDFEEMLRALETLESLPSEEPLPAVHGLEVGEG
jgi:anti-sigma factor RsiW